MKTCYYPNSLKMLFTCILFCILPQWQANACEGTSKPPCGQTIWFIILTPKNIAMPQNGPVNIPVILVPYIFWNTNAGCAQPTLTGNTQIDERASAKLQVEIDVKFISVKTGNLSEFGIQTFDLPVPITPGLQTMNAVITVPDGQLDPDDTYTGQFNGTATVTFGSGVGMGALSASGSAQAYLVPAASGFPDIPRVNVEYIPVMENDPGYAVCRRGDQAYMHFLVSNNDLTNAVTLDLSTQIGQVAGLPDGFDPANAENNYNSGVYAISNPTGDYFNHRLVSNPATWELIAEGDPHLNPASLGMQLTLLAGEAKFVTVCVRSFGMCANGSCNKLTLRGEGQFTDGAQALVCASSALVVGDAPQKSRRCEFLDEIKTSDDSQTCFSKGVFFNSKFEPLPHASTHSNGNINPGSTSTGWWLYGANTQSEPGMFNAVSDYIRFDQNAVVGGAVYSLQHSGTTGTAINEVVIYPLPSDVATQISVPVIKYLPFPLTRIIVRPDVDSVEIRTISGDMVVYSGKYSEFLENPPSEFSLDFSSCRTFTKVSGLEAREICADVYNFGLLHKVTDGPEQCINVFDQTGVPIMGNVSIVGNLFEPSMQAFNGKMNFNLVKSNIPFAPNRAVGLFNINAPNTVAPLIIPFGISKLERLGYIVTNEQDLVRALCAIQARRGDVDVTFAPARGDILLTDLAANKGFFEGDNVVIDGNIRSSQAAVIIDGSGCPAPCNVFKFVGNKNQIENIQLVNFPQNALTIEGNMNSVSSCTFRDNGGSGVVIDTGVGNAILTGSFYRNGGLGIDLGGDGVTVNDPADMDTGANLLQNYPVLTKASVDDINGGTLLEGSLHSAPNSTFSLQFYSSDTCSNSGFGEGHLYMTELPVTTDAQGDVIFSFTASTVTPMGASISATATDPDGSTSEFSACKEVIGTTATKEVVNAYDLKVYPNPASDVLNIQFHIEGNVGVAIDLLTTYGSASRIIQEGALGAGDYNISTPISHLPPGLYFVHTRLGNTVEATKLIIQ